MFFSPGWLLLLYLIPVLSMIPAVLICQWWSPFLQLIQKFRFVS